MYGLLVQRRRRFPRKRVVVRASHAGDPRFVRILRTPRPFAESPINNEQCSEMPRRTSREEHRQMSDTARRTSREEHRAYHCQVSDTAVMAERTLLHDRQLLGYVSSMPRDVCDEELPHRQRAEGSTALNGLQQRVARE